MTRESITQALETEGLSTGAHGFTIPENREAVCLVAAPGEVFSVDKLIRLELRDKVMLLENTKHERFFFAYEDVLGLKLLAAPAVRERVAGFGR